MKLNLRSICVTSSLAVLLSLASVAHASTITGGVYNISGYPSNLDPAQFIPANEIATFTLNSVNLYGGPNDGSPSYTVAGFLSSGGAGTLTSFTPTAGNPTAGTQSLNNKGLELTGSTFFAVGDYTVTHDDGVLLYLNGASGANCTICSAAPTAAIPSTFHIGAAGNYNFNLYYAEVNGAPATLNVPFAAIAATPEPSSFILLGSGLLSAAGLIRRRLSR